MGALNGKTALVTGGSRGIGHAIAIRLAADGALVVVHYGRDDAAAASTVKEIHEAGGQAFAVGALLGVPGDVESLWTEFDAGLAAAGAEPGLDILVNNAAIATSESLTAVTPEDFDALSRSTSVPRSSSSSKAWNGSATTAGSSTSPPASPELRTRRLSRTP